MKIRKKLICALLVLSCILLSGVVYHKEVVMADTTTDDTDKGDTGGATNNVYKFHYTYDSTAIKLRVVTTNAIYYSHTQTRETDHTFEYGDNSTLYTANPQLGTSLSAACTSAGYDYADVVAGLKNKGYSDKGNGVWVKKDSSGNVTAYLTYIKWEDVIASYTKEVHVRYQNADGTWPSYEHKSTLSGKKGSSYSTTWGNTTGDAWWSSTQSGTFTNNDKIYVDCPRRYVLVRYTIGGTDVAIGNSAYAAGTYGVMYHTSNSAWVQDKFYYGQTSFDAYNAGTPTFCYTRTGYTLKSGAEWLINNQTPVSQASTTDATALAKIQSFITETSAGAKNSADDVVVCYPNWIVNESHVAYHSNGGAANSGYTLNQYGFAHVSGAADYLRTPFKYTDTTIDLYDVGTLFSRTGYHIADANKAWLVGSATSNTIISQNTNADALAAVKSAANINNSTGQCVYLYANWIPNYYNLRYNANKPSNASGNVAGTNADTRHTYDIEYAVAADGDVNYDSSTTSRNDATRNNAFTLTGWDFVQWTTDAANKTALGTVHNETATNGGTVDVYAQWKAHTYEVQYIANTPSIATNAVQGTVANTTHTYDTHYPITQGENRGDTAGGDVKYDNGGVCNATRENTYTLKGWTFVGWSKTADGSSGIVTEIYNYTSTQGSTVKLYAQWRPNVYTVVYDKNKPSNASSDVLGTTANTTHKYDHQYNIDTENAGIGNVYKATCSVDGTSNTTILRNNGYSLKGWIFKGWSTTKDGSSGILSNIKNLTDVEKGSVTLYAQWEPIKFKVVYHMNLPKNADITISSNGLSLHTVAGSAYTLPTTSTFYSGNSWLGKTVSTTYSSNSNAQNYCYIGTKTYTYDSTDWTLENLQITVNDAYFTGWTYYDIVYQGSFPAGSTNGTKNGFYFNGVTNGDASMLTIAANGTLSSTNRTGTVIGGSIDATYDVTKDYALKTLTMATNPFYNVNQVAINNGGGDIYLVLKANWTSAVSADIKYHSNNGSTEAIYTQDLGNVNLSNYVSILGISNNALADDLFGKPYSKFTTSGNGSNMRLLDAWRLPDVTENSFASGGGALGDDGSYDSTATGDQFVVNTDANSKYHFGTSLGRKGFFSFQGWSTWKYASWRDNISSNKQDDGTAWDATNSYQPTGKDSYSTKTNVTTGTNGLAITKFNGGARMKRLGDLFYRYGITAISSEQSINGTKSNTNTIASDYATGHTDTTANTLYNAFKWRVTQGVSGTYSQFISLVKNPVIHMYAIWDSYVTTDISNVYVYTEDDSDDDIAVLTPKYLFSKVIAYEYEDLESFGANNNRYIGGSRTWSSVCDANVDMSLTTSGDKTYSYTMTGSQGGYSGGTFKATLLNYDYNMFKEAKESAINAANNSQENEIQSVALTWKFEDSAGNITYRTSWVYILDRTNKGATNADDTVDDTRQAITRFIDSGSFFGDGTHSYVTMNGTSLNNANSNGAVNSRSKWKINPSYTTALANALSSLKALGDSALTINTSDALGFKVDYSGNYHPKNEDGTWVYDWNAIKSKTEGIYQFDYNDIVNSKQHDGRGNYESTNYSALQEYIDDILKDTAIEGHRVAN